MAGVRTGRGGTAGAADRAGFLDWPSGGKSSGTHVPAPLDLCGCRADGAGCALATRQIGTGQAVARQDVRAATAVASYPTRSSQPSYDPEVCLAENGGQERLEEKGAAGSGRAARQVRRRRAGATAGPRGRHGPPAGAAQACIALSRRSKACRRAERPARPYGGPRRAGPAARPPSPSPEAPSASRSSSVAERIVAAYWKLEGRDIYKGGGR